MKTHSAALTELFFQAIFIQAWIIKLINDGRAGDPIIICLQMHFVMIAEEIEFLMEGRL